MKAKQYTDSPLHTLFSNANLIKKAMTASHSLLEFYVNNIS